VSTVLLPADEALVLRDHGLAGLGLLLDEDRLGTWLADQLGAPTTWNTRYLRYKQGTSCLIAGDLETAEGTRSCFAAAHTTDALEKLTKTLQRAPAGSVLGTDPARGLVVASPAADRDLPGLALLHDERRSRRLLCGLLGERDGVRDAQRRTLRYKPQRRWVGLVQPRGGPAAVLRIYRPAAARRAVEAIRACAAGGGTPALIGANPSRGVAAVAYLPGRALSHVSGAGESGDRAAIRSAGTALARLHGARDLALRNRGSADAKAVLSAADQLVALLPSEADGIRGLAARVIGRLLNSEQLQLPIHGDFSLDQVVVDETGTARLIDLDEAHLGDPASDLGCAAAALARDAVLGKVSDGLATSWLEALHEGYADVLDPPAEGRLAAHTAAHLLRRAVEPFRLRQTADWPEAARELLARAHQIVTSHSFMEGVR
jgi:aminoglycoside phosphotransferase (APT) family kinase protein